MLYDVFICHASEDKTAFVRPLAEKLQDNHLSVWYDEFSLKVGDSIRRSIDIGLTKSRYGVVVLSKNFFNKQWPQWELDGLVQRQNDVKANVILPIWYGVTKKDVVAFSAPLADKVAILASKGIDHVVSELLTVLKAEGSTLLIARDRLLQFGYEPPVVTDDWWLDVVEYSGSYYSWERWAFPLPGRGNTPCERGEYLAWAALQMMWQGNVDDARISQITHPSEVLQFISSQPGLIEACHKHPEYLAAYAPQLTIKGFGGEFEHDFQALYEQSVLQCRSSLGGTALTTDGSSPACDSIWALRHPTFGNYKPSRISCNFVIGELMGLPVRVYEVVDYLVWFLSNQSSWIPKEIHKFLLEGFKEWPAWCWAPNQSTGALFCAMCDAKTFDKFNLTKPCLHDIETRFNCTVNLLGLGETTESLAQRFIRSGLIEGWFKRSKERTRRSKS